MLPESKREEVFIVPLREERARRKCLALIEASEIRGLKAQTVASG
jgi:hypothetical protein